MLNITKLLLLRNFVFGCFKFFSTQNQVPQRIIIVCGLQISIKSMLARFTRSKLDENSKIRTGFRFFSSPEVFFGNFSLIHSDHD